MRLDHLLSKETKFLHYEFYGELAQLGEHLPCTQGVKGSSPLFSTRESFRARTRKGASVKNVHTAYEGLGSGSRRRKREPKDGGTAKQERKAPYSPPESLRREAESSESTLKTEQQKARTQAREIRETKGRKSKEDL